MKLGRWQPSRSSAAWKKGISIGAGVIDSDYRDEVKIVVFNLTYDVLFLKHGEAVAQLILEVISTPTLVQVLEFDSTSRSGGFGSTDNHPKDDEVEIYTTTSTGQMHTPEWDHLMNQLLPVMKTPINDIPSRQHHHSLYVLQQQEWTNPFAEGGGISYPSSSFDSFSTDYLSAFSEEMDEYVAMIDDSEPELDYPAQKEAIFASSSAISTYNPQADSIMGPPQYAPATGERPKVPNLGVSTHLPSEPPLQHRLISGHEERDPSPSFKSLSPHLFVAILTTGAYCSDQPLDGDRVSSHLVLSSRALYCGGDLVSAEYLERFGKKVVIKVEITNCLQDLTASVSLSRCSAVGIAKSSITKSSAVSIFQATFNRRVFPIIIGFLATSDLTSRLFSTNQKD
ncbi:hypothetical protein ZIOFF_056755 [Zingiber officinale]|uniref:Deoxyuridine 5'-triphosphate nucleotidohydrolase n=1 Tax=Zingiber officinale TaxID=94328 RepID=A0A8J5KFJ1_ZINOF|nr:hypothetical protein ZIOFF_056755 [Zingiber officinale]